MAYRDQETLMPAAPVILTIRRQQQGMVFDLFEVEPLMQNTFVRFDDRLTANLIAELTTITAYYNALLNKISGSAIEKNVLPEIAQRLRRIGRVIHEQLFPDPIKRMLAARDSGNLFLRLEESLLEIPWELSFDGRDFLFNRFHVGRQVITSQPFSPTRGQVHYNKNPLRLLIVCDPTESLPAAVEETETLLAILDRHDSVKVEVLGGQRATKLEVLSALSEFSCIHFAGHSVFDPANAENSGWVLNNALLSTVEMSKISEPPLLVFSNSCLSAQTNRWDVPNLLGQASLGIGGSFLVAGVRHTIGALWVIHDRSSARFAGRFYSHLFSGKTIGEALSHAKRQEPGKEEGIYLFGAGYVHYGRPDDRLFGEIETDDNEIKGPGLHRAAPAVPFLKRNIKWTWLMVASVLVLVLAALVGVALLYGTHFFNGSSKFSPLLTAYEKALEDYRHGRISAAVGAFQRLLKRTDNTYNLGYGDLAEIYLEAGSISKAGEILNQAMAKPICNSLTYIIAGDLALQEGDSVGASAAYQKALLMEGFPPYQTARALNALGILCFLRADNGCAADFFANALSKNKNDPDAGFNLGVLAYLEDYRQKATELISAVTGGPSQDELVSLFSTHVLKTANEGISKPGPPTAGKTALLIGPFYLKGGVVKRLGLDMVLARLLGQYLSRSEIGLRYSLKQSNCADFVGRTDGAADMDPRDHRLLQYIRSQGVATAICGNLFLYRHVFYANIKVLDVSTGVVILALDIKTEDPGKIQKMADRLGDELVQALGSP